MSRLRTTSMAIASAMSGGCAPEASPVRDDQDPVPFASATAGDTGDTGEASGDTGMPPTPGEATELCTDAFTIDEGKHLGSLRGRQPELGGACGLGGPDVFFRLEVPRRSDVWIEARGVGITPRVGVLPHGCAAEWMDRGLACIEGLGGWILDVGAASSLVLSVGLDPEDPALLVPAPTEGPDALDFVLDVRLRDVLDVGDPCEPPGRGRCGAGTACLRPHEDEGGVAVCTALVADTCATAAPVELAMGANTVEIPAGALHTDAHVHSCAGARRVERVLALSVPSSDASARLTISTTHADVGLALREIDCDPDAELACDAPAEGGARVVADLPVGTASVLLFVEMPGGDPGAEPAPDDDDAGEEAPIVLQVDVSAPG